MTPEDRAIIRKGKAIKARTSLLSKPKKEKIGAPQVSLTPLSKEPKGKTPPITEVFASESRPYISGDDRKPETFEQLALFVPAAMEEMQKNACDANMFRKLCTTAIAKGGISLQDFFAKFGDDVIPRNVDKSLEQWPLPAPNIVKEILALFSTFDPDQFTGNKLPWRHRQYVPPAAKPEPQG